MRRINRKAYNAVQLQEFKRYSYHFFTSVTPISKHRPCRPFSSELSLGPRASRSAGGTGIATNIAICVGSGGVAGGSEPETIFGSRSESGVDGLMEC